MEPDLLHVARIITSFTNTVILQTVVHAACKNFFDRQIDESPVSKTTCKIFAQTKN